MNAERLYTPGLLAAAMELAGWPALSNAPLHGSSRASACGSTLAMDLALGEAGAISRLGMAVRACAVGQAAACVFARHAIGQTPAEIATAHDAINSWLARDDRLPGWPDLSLIAPARNFPARHGAMLLPWKAALAALSSDAVAS